MRARDAVGKRIVRINQDRLWNPNTSDWVTNVRSIELENGTLLIPVTVETDCEYSIELDVVKNRSQR